MSTSTNNAHEQRSSAKDQPIHQSTTNQPTYRRRVLQRPHGIDLGLLHRPLHGRQAANVPPVQGLQFDGRSTLHQTGARENPQVFPLLPPFLGHPRLPPGHAHQSFLLRLVGPFQTCVQHVLLLVHPCPFFADVAVDLLPLQPGGGLLARHHVVLPPHQRHGPKVLQRQGKNPEFQILFRLVQQLLLVRPGPNGLFPFAALGGVGGDFVVTVLRCPASFRLLPSIFQSFGVGLDAKGGGKQGVGSKGVEAREKKQPTFMSEHLSVRSPQNTQNVFPNTNSSHTHHTRITPHSPVLSLQTTVSGPLCATKARNRRLEIPIPVPQNTTLPTSNPRCCPRFDWPTNPQ